ncbi:MAG: FGGY-family carbohydrate kinase [Granulosicoccus sp.]
MPRYVAVIDLGKTNSKVALVDTSKATEILVITQPAASDSTTLYPSLDHQAIKIFVLDALRTLRATHKIDAITVTTHGATAALINAEGQLALPVMDYEFTDIDELRPEYDRYRPTFADTGSPALPGGLNIGAQLYWQQKHYPTQFSQTSTLLTWPQYWVFILTGERHNDVTSLGCHSDLYEPLRQRYSMLIDNMNWQSLMPATKHSGQLSGTLNPNIASAVGIPPGTPVYTGIHDSNASLVPHLISHEAPYSVVSTGTWFIAMSIGGTLTVLDEKKDTLLNINARGDNVPSARFMGGRERELLGVSNDVTDQSMDELLANSTSPAMLMPSVVPGTGPHPDLPKTWLGADVRHDQSLSDCAATLYLALMTYESMQLVGCQGATYIEGPMAHDRHYARMLAAISHGPVYISASQTGTSVGAAMLISAPETLPEYTLVNLDSAQRQKLKHYANLWQDQLQIHCR